MPVFWLFIDLLAGEGGRGGIKSLRVTARKRAENLLARHLFSCQINQRLSAIFEATIFPEKGIWEAYGKITEGRIGRLALPRQIDQGHISVRLGRAGQS